MGHQDEDDFDVFDDNDNIIDRLNCERNQVRFRVNSIAVINNLPITNVDRLPIRDNSVVSPLTSSSSKVAGRRKGGRNKSAIDKIKHLLNDCGSPSQ